MFRGHGHIRQRQIAGQDGNQPEEMDPRRWVGACEDDFEERETGVERVFRDVGPGGEDLREPTGGVDAPEDDAPVHDGNEEGEGGYGCVEEGVEGLEGAGKSVEERGAAMKGVGEGVDGGGEKVEGYAPVTEDWWSVLVSCGRKCRSREGYGNVLVK